MIISLVRDKAGISQKEIAKYLDVNRDRVGYHLREMVKDGSLTATRKGKFTVYSVTN